MLQSYNGGNKQPYEQGQMATDMETIRQTIFEDGTIGGKQIMCIADEIILYDILVVDVEELSTDQGAYGEHSAISITESAIYFFSQAPTRAQDIYSPLWKCLQMLLITLGGWILTKPLPKSSGRMATHPLVGMNADWSLFKLDLTFI